MKAELITHMGEPPLTKSDLAILDAIAAGYHADANGAIFNPSGAQMRGTPKKAGHISVSLPNPHGTARCQPVLAHRFVMGYFFGVDALLYECIRHLNDDPRDNRVANLACGTKKENRADIPREKLSRIAKAQAHKLVERSRKLVDDDVRRLRKMRHDEGTPYHKLADVFGVSTMTAYRAVTGQSWGDVV